MNEQLEKHAWTEIDAALRSAPLARVPTTLAPAVMARVRALAAPKPRFSLTWLDLALPLFATLMFVVASAAWFNWPTQLSIAAANELNWLWLAIVQPLIAFVSGPALLMSLGLIITTVVAAMLILRQPALIIES